jgi:AAA+ ATPase superfamily predicted ATPase
MIGRKYEIELLRKRVQSKKPELGIVYGRRRVGKSHLLKSIITKPSTGDMYFEAIRGYPLQKQIDHFCKQLSEQTNTVQVKADSWEKAFDAFTPHILRGKHYVVLDELPWMASERQELINILKYYWDLKWKSNPGLKLILCGSIAHFMIKHVVHSEALHNRKTFELKVDPLPAYEAQDFFAGRKSKLEITKFLLTFGGIPKYLEQLDPRESYTISVDNLCFQKAGFFVNEFETIFKEQFKTTRSYGKIVRALLKGAKTKEEIAEIASISAGGSLTLYLENLERADFIKKRTSISFVGGQRKSKTHKYVLWDEWLRFYLTFMEPAIDLVQKNTKSGLFLKRTGLELATYWGHCFESFCEKNIAVILNRLQISESEIITIGPYFQQPLRSLNKTGVQIDLLVFRKGQVVSLIECKFSENPIGIKIIHEIERKISGLGLSKKYTIEKILVTAGPLSRDLEVSDYFNQVIVIDDFYNFKS